VGLRRTQNLRLESGFQSQFQLRGDGGGQHLETLNTKPQFRKKILLHLRRQENDPQGLWIALHLQTISAGIGHEMTVV
jgi:hypothetical protein